MNRDEAKKQVKITETLMSGKGIVDINIHLTRKSPKYQFFITIKCNNIITNVM